MFQLLRQIFAFCLLVAACLESGASPHAALGVGPVPSWVVAPLDPLATPPPLESIDSINEAPADLDYLVSERQELTRDAAAYVHFAYRVAEPAVLRQAAEFSLTFDPAYQRVEFHHIRLFRDGNAEERLDLEAMDILRLERDRDRALYDGRLTAIQHLRDVRVGDVIDYAYTVTGANPVFGDHYVQTLSLGWSIPVRQFRYRLLHPTDRPLHHRLRGDDPPAPVSRPAGAGLTELLWEQAPVPERVLETDAPAWHPILPFVQLGQFADWSDVVAWALPLYQSRDESPGLRERIELLRTSADSPERRLLAALKFVQEDIRYLGMELGPNSHRPTVPAETLARRFGDCKDKTLLLCTLLRGLGFEAHPALVNTVYGPRLEESLPTPLAFDHVIVRVRAPDGTVRWLDPTRLHQVGELDQRQASDFGHALLIREGESGLVRMDIPTESHGRLREDISLTSHGFDQPVDFAIESTFTGERATAMRAYLAGTGVAKVGRDYANYYLQKYPGLTVAEPVSWEDDHASNTVRLRERYRVADFWTVPDDGGQRCELYPYSIGDLVSSPLNQQRRTPLALAYPSETLVNIHLRLHEDWSGSDFGERIDEPQLFYISSAQFESARDLRISHHLRMKADHVSASDVAAHAKTLARIRADLGFYLTKPAAVAAEPAAPVAPPGFRLNPWMVLVTLLSFAGSGYVAWRVLARRGQPPPLPGPPARPIGGWLLLLSIGVIGRCFILPASLLPVLKNMFDDNVWDALVAADSAARSLPVAFLMLAEMIANSALITANVLAAILFLKRRREAPRWNVMVLIASFALPALDAIVASGIDGTQSDAETTRALSRAFVGALIWVPYLLVSQRVKETFVR